MLVKCKSALLLSDVESFSKTYEAIAEEVNVELKVESEWSERYRLTQEVVILGSKYLDSLNSIYYPNAVLILKENENPYTFLQKGITRFIFDYHNKYELFMSLFKAEPVTVHMAQLSLEGILKESQIWNYQFGDYDFKFDKDRFFYKGKPIYLANAQKRYLAEWLLNGHKDNSRRMLLCNMRKKFGKDFLADIDRFGICKEDKDE
jgi:hypothetical protein